MPKLSKTNLKKQRKKVKTSTTAENKLLKTILNLFSIKLPNKATPYDVRKAINKLPYSKIDKYVSKYAVDLFRENRNGFLKIINALATNKTANEKKRLELDAANRSMMADIKMYKPLMEQFERNVKLIKDLPFDVAAKLEQGYKQGVQFRGTEVEKYIREKMGTRAKLIIRTESSKLNTAITEIRSAKLGIPAYIWSTSEDKRVRASHRVMDGVLVFWNTKLTLDKMTGHAGEFPNCRCLPIAVVDLRDLKFPIKVAEGNLTITSKYIKGTHGKGYNTTIQSGRIATYNRQDFLRAYGNKFH